MKIRKVFQGLSMLLMLLLLFGCATNNVVKTSTGKADVTFHGVDRKDIKDALVNAMLSSGYYLRNQNDYQLIFGIEDSRLVLVLLAGSRFNSTPEIRYTFNIVDYSGGVRVLTNIGVVTNPGTAFESITDISKNSRAAQDMQTSLERLRDNMETASMVKKRGKVGVRVLNGVIAEVINESPAEKAGLLKGDVIKKIDGVLASSIDNENLMRISGEPDTVVKLTILRDGLEMEFDVVRGQP